MGFGVSSLLLVALGGALGGIGRFAISNLMARYMGNAFPWGTLAVNVLGSLVAGAWLGHHTSAEIWQLLAITGLLGGFTTVSSFSLQTIELWQGEHAIRAVINVATTLLLGFAMAMLGWYLAGGAR